LKTVFKTKAGQ